MSEWRPIESAPKDGRRIIVGWPGVTGNTGYYSQGQRAFCDRMTRRPYFPEQPTHWWPLPDPPEEPTS